jgi:DNA invertase Pin-like site-specific DNA recombinase
MQPCGGVKSGSAATTVCGSSPVASRSARSATRSAAPGRTTTPGGKLVFHIFGALAEFERNLIRDRTYAGLTAARARGRKGGRRKKLGEKQRAVAVDLYRQKKHSIDESCKAVGIPRPTLYEYVWEADAHTATDGC